MASKNSSKTKKHSLFHVRLSSVNDLARYACNFTPSSRNLFASALDGKKAIIAFGETIGNTTIAYYANVDKYCRVVAYTNGQGIGEKVETLENIGAIDKPDMYYINVVEIGNAPFNKAKKLKTNELQIININVADELIKGLIKKSMEKGAIEHVYVFQQNGAATICAFDVFEDLANGNSVLYYSRLKSKTEAKFARYNYSRNAVDFSNDFGEHTYLYVKLIYLAQPFGFFKQ